MTSEPFPPVAYEGSHFVLGCDAARGSHLSYSWYFNRKDITSSTSSPSFRLDGNKLVLEKVSHDHAGQYSCLAWSLVHAESRVSSSPDVQLIVKGKVDEWKDGPGLCF